MNLVKIVVEVPEEFDTEEKLLKWFNSLQFFLGEVKKLKVVGVDTWLFRKKDFPLLK